MRNQVLYHYEVAGKIKEIRNCDSSDFQTEVRRAFGRNDVLVSGEYLTDGDHFRTCTARLYEREDVFVVVGFTKKFGKVNVHKISVEVSLSALLDPQTFNKVVHVSHDDLDGESPLILTRLAFQDKEIVTRGCHYETVDEITMNLIRDEVNKEDTIMFITDISVNPENLSKINDLVQEGYRIFMLDHHDAKESVPVKKYASWMKLDQTYPDGRGTAATSMYYEFLVKHGFIARTLVLDDYVELVRQYDTWEWADAENLRAKRLNDYYFMVNREEFSGDVLSTLKGNPEDVDPNVMFRSETHFSFDSQIEYMLDMEQKRIEEYCKSKHKQLEIFKGLVDGTDRIYTFGVVSAETYQSELGNYLCKELINEVDFVVMMDVGKKKMSLRSNKAKDVNVGAIARSVGGGGRAQTAGCPLNQKTKYLFLDRFLFEKLG